MSAVFSAFQNFQAASDGAALPSLDALRPGEIIKQPEDIRRDWLLRRRGKFTASEFHRLMAYQGKAELPKGGQTYAMEKALEIMTEFQPDNYVSPAMQWGIDKEPEAVREFMARTGLEVAAHGDGQIFLPLGSDIGGTPDGLIPLEKSGIEIKCPMSRTHLSYFYIKDEDSLKAIAPEYYWQVQGLMDINLSDWWYFISFDPRFIPPYEGLRLHIAKIYRNELDIRDLRVRLDMAIRFRNEVIERYKK